MPSARHWAPAWRRIARELLLESILLGVAGGALGLALAFAALRSLAASRLAHLPRVENLSIDFQVLAFTLAISLAAGVMFGLMPVFKYARPQLSNALAGGGRSSTEGKERHRARSLLVVVQVALAAVLLVGSGLMIRTFRALRHVDPGFTADHVQTLHVFIPETQAKEAEHAIRMEQAILDRSRRSPACPSVAIVNTLPTDGGFNDPVMVEDQPRRDGTLPPIRRYKWISPGYVSAMGSRLIAGREMTWPRSYGALRLRWFRKTWPASCGATLTPRSETHPSESGRRLARSGRRARRSAR